MAPTKSQAKPKLKPAANDFQSFVTNGTIAPSSNVNHKIVHPG